MVISADTSFLFSLYGNDSKTPAAIEWSKRNPHPIAITQLNHFELINALRFAECRSFIATGNAELFASQFRFDFTGGRLIEAHCDLADVLKEANRLSLAHTLTGGHRGFDILHVAAARLIRATHFLTFDANQKKLATREGLIVPF
ncbi:MAG: type II toxin-antitoxin system VapC family toxin [Luteolibacter sp.]